MSPFRLACPVMIGAAFCFGPDAYSASADPRPPGITHFEVATGLAVDEPTAVTGSAKPGGPGPATLRFNAFGNRFELEVRPNYRLVAPLLARGQLAYDDVRVFTATLPSVPGSWGRFTLRGEQVTGVLWDGTTMYLVDTAANLQSLLPSPVPAGSIVVFKAADVHFPIDAGGSATSASISGEELIAHSVALMRKSELMQPLPTRRIGLGLLGDSSYAVIEAPGDQAMTDANQADGIFTSQMDIHFRVERLNMLDESSDPLLGSSDAGVLLERLVAFKKSSPEYGPLGLVHVLSRREMNDNIGGVAQLRSVCGPDQGAGITSVLHGISWLIMAHEIAHNFGAPHDGEAGACQAVPPTFLMAPEHNASEQFSQCSLQQMEQFLSQASCLTSVGAGELELAVQPLPPVLYHNEPFRITYFLNSVGGDSVFDVGTRIETDPDFELTLFYTEGFGVLCDFIVGPDSGECRFGTMHGGGSAQFGAELIPHTAGPVQFVLRSSALNDTDPGNNEAVITVEVQPATYIFSRGEDVPNVGRGQTAVTTIKVENLGDFPSAAGLEIWNDEGHQLTTAVPFCRQVDAFRLACDIDTMAPREVRRFELEVTPGPVSLGLDDQKTLSIWLETVTELHGSVAADRVRHFLTLWGSWKDMRTEFATAPPDVTVGESGEYVVAVTNDGPDATLATWLEVTHTPGVQIDEVLRDGGGCTWANREAACEITRMEAGERVEVTVRFSASAASTQRVVATASSMGFDFNRDNDSATAAQVVAPKQPLPGTAGGGGGAGDWLLLMGAVGFALRRPARRRRGPGRPPGVRPLKTRRAAP